MKIRKLLAATGVAVALTPAALAAVIMATHPKDGSVLKAIQEAVGTELTLDQLIGVEPANAPAASEQAAESEPPAADGKLAPVITGTLDSARVGYHLAELMQGDEPDPFSGNSSAEVVAALGDPVSPQPQPAFSQASGGNFAISGAIGGRAAPGAGGGAGIGAAAGGGGDAVSLGPNELLIGGTGLTPAASLGPEPAVLPMESPVQQANSPVEESVEALKEDRPGGPQGRPVFHLAQRDVLAMPVPTSLWLFLAAMIGLALLGRSGAPS
jgi:hypothetical protein